VHRNERNGSVAWRVRWREGARGSRARTRTFGRKADAAAFEDELRRRRRLGELGLMPGSQETLDEYAVRRGRRRTRSRWHPRPPSTTPASMTCTSRRTSAITSSQS
jgi:hypothetical protein